MKKRTSEIATSLWQKTALVLLGLILSLVLLEVGMRLGGFVLLSIQEYGNLRSIKQKGAYRILCLGESTTQGQYPHLLEQVLNQRNIGVRFSVIDKGRDGANTLFLLSRLESYLTEYHPDMVVTMMGINDRGRHMPLEMMTPSEGTPFIRSLRTYKLARLLWLHLLTKTKEIGLYQPAGDSRGAVKVHARTALQETSAEAIFTEDNPKNDDAYVELWRLLKQGKLSQGEDLVKKAIEINPRKDDACVGLGRLYLKQGQLSQGEDFLKKALEFNPKNADAYAEFGRFYYLQEKFSQAEDSLKKAIELNPKNDEGYYGLGWLYQRQGKFSQAEDISKKGVELNPENIKIRNMLGRSFQGQGKFQQAEDTFKKAIALDPANAFNFFELASLYREQDKLSQVENVLRKAGEIYPKNDCVHAAISLLYEEMGKPDLAKEYAEKTNQLRLENRVTFTVNNYRKLKKILDRRGIKLVCVQYPTRNVEPLKKIFGKDESVVFVDNESVFKEALKKSGYKYKEYFRDMFGGDFGHCTQKGNELLAQNIADVILREIFNK